MTSPTVLLMSSRVVGIDCVIAAMTLLIDNNAKDMRSSLREHCFYLLEISSIGASDINYHKRAIDLGCQDAGIR